MTAEPRRGSYTRPVEPTTLIGEEDPEDLVDIPPFIILPPVQRGVDTFQASEGGAKAGVDEVDEVGEVDEPQP